MKLLTISRERETSVPRGMILFFFSKADGQAEVITGVRKAFEEVLIVLEVVVTMGNQSCFVSKQNFSEENLAEFGFRSESR